jgi:endonuclease/exonuclease/phosphatase family metal-dependent hydrolase
MKRHLIAIIALFAFATTLSAKALNPQPATLRVGSYNIRLQPGDKKTPNAWNERKADFLNLLRKMDLDAFGLQEVCPGQAEYITNNLPQYVLVGEHRNADRVSGEASPVLYRKDRFEALKCGTFWLSETPDVPGHKGWGAACPRVCSWMWLKDRRTGKTFCFANTHTDHVSALARKEGMLLIIRRMHEFAPPGTPVVFTGDHNCRETEEPAQAVSKLLRNALYITETPPKGPWRTFTGWKWRDTEYSAVDALKLQPNVRNARKGSPDADKMKNGGYVWEDCGPRIDYIYVSDGIKVKSYTTWADPRPGTHLYPSDHFPVTATIEL